MTRQRSARELPPQVEQPSELVSKRQPVLPRRRLQPSVRCCRHPNHARGIRPHEHECMHSTRTRQGREAGTCTDGPFPPLRQRCVCSTTRSSGHGQFHSWQQFSQHSSHSQKDSSHSSFDTVMQTQHNVAQSSPLSPWRSRHRSPARPATPSTRWALMNDRATVVTQKQVRIRLPVGTTAGAPNNLLQVNHSPTAPSESSSRRRTNRHVS